MNTERQNLAVKYGLMLGILGASTVKNDADDWDHEAMRLVATHLVGAGEEITDVIAYSGWYGHCCANLGLPSVYKRDADIVQALVTAVHNWTDSKLKTELSILANKVEAVGLVDAAFLELIRK